MLVDVKNHGTSKKLYDGIYESNWWNFELTFRDRQNYDLDYPRFKEFNCVGVCDSPKQLLEKLPKEVTESETNYVISMVKINKEDQEPSGGWRWHMWGKYIGEQNPQEEYLYDEPYIDSVWTFHIYQVS